MAGTWFPDGEFIFGRIEDKLSSSNRSFEHVEQGIKGKQVHSYGVEDWGESCGFDSVCWGLEIYAGKTHHHHHQQQQSYSEYKLLDDLRFDVVSPPIQTYLDELRNLAEIPPGIQHNDEVMEKKFPSSLASLELLNNYGNNNRFKQFNGETKIDRKVAMSELSTEEIMRVAATKFIQSSYQLVDGLSFTNHPFISSSNLSSEEMKNVELAECLLASAEKVGYQQFDRAIKLLNLCDHLCSKTGNSVQRVVYYFSEALREKIDRETGRNTSNGLWKQESYDVEKEIFTPNLTSLACQTEMPFSQVGQIAGIQAIIENVTDSNKVHIIDLGIGNGSQWTVLMQGLVARYESPIQLLKITAIGTNLKHVIEDTGKRLTSFAKTMNLPFCFKILMVSEMLDLKQDMFEVDDAEAVALYSAYSLRTMIKQPNQLDYLMRMIKSISPRLMVVTEVEANHNSPVFFSRFTEALFFFSAFFDCLESCMRTDPNRINVESVYFSQGIKNIVAAEGHDRSIRNVKIDAWRAFFARFGMVETELSMSALYQVSLVLKQFECRKYCTLDMNGKCLIIGWKGAPIQSLSVWKFS